MMPENVTLVPIPTALYARVQAVLERSPHASVDAFVAHAVRVALATEEPTNQPDPSDEARIAERLRRLGYID
jgi:hypothetical protein